MKKKLIAKIIILTLCLSACASGYLCFAYSGDLNKGLSDRLVRLHVIANSDSPEDQALKRDVRDVILNYMKDRYTSSKNVDETKALIKSNLKEIEEISEKEIKRHNVNYGVNAMLGNYPFPTKAYGDITLPAGNYDALRVVIGKGEGANWWCVLFPPLCFVDATHGTIPDSVKENLKNSLTDEEYSIITSSDNDEDIPIKVKFKLVEILQNSKIKFTGAISSIFRSGK